MSRRLGLSRLIRAVLVLTWAGAVIPLQAEGSDFDEYLHYNRRFLDAYTQGVCFDTEFGDDEGFVLRGGYSRWWRFGDSPLFSRAGVLAGYHFTKQAFDLVPEIQLGLSPVFVGVSYPLSDRPWFGDLTYEFGLTALLVDAKVMTTDFKTTTFSFALHLPLEAIEKARQDREAARLVPASAAP